jgi:cytohesin
LNWNDPNSFKLSKFQALLKESPCLVFARWGNSTTALHLAAEYGEEDVIKLLLANGADVNAKDNNGRTPLHLAAASGHDYWSIPDMQDVATLLLKNGANVNAKDNQGQTPLQLVHFAREMAQLLQNHGADINVPEARPDTGDSVEQATREAITRADLPKLRALIRENPKLANLVFSNNSVTPTPLCLAARLGRKDVVELLLAHGAAVYPSGDAAKWGITPLNLASNSAVAELLLAHGASVNSRTEWGDSKGWTPLHYAAGAGRKDVVEVPLAHGADVNARSRDNITPLEVTSDSAVAELLSQHGGHK